MALLLLRRDAEAAAELDAIPQPYGEAEILIQWRRIALAERAGDEAMAAALADRLAALADADGPALLEHRIIAYFDLGDFRNRRREPVEAFAHWCAGHRLLQRVQPFSRAKFAEFVDTSVASFDAMRLRDGARAQNVDEAPVFIVGLPRSGTSLTEQILAAHPQVHGGGERAHLARAAFQLAGSSLEPQSITRLAALGAPVLTETAAAFCHELRQEAPQARYILDKMPGNALHLGFVATLLPRARIILCRRDLRDVGLSIFQLRFFGYHPYAHDLGDLGWYLGEHERLMRHWCSVLPLPLMTVELTDWVHDFNGTLARVLAFLDLPHDAACERFYQQRRRVRTASAMQVRQPINSRGLGRWRAFEPQLAPMLTELQQAGLDVHSPSDKSL